MSARSGSIVFERLAYLRWPSRWEARQAIRSTGCPAAFRNTSWLARCFMTSVVRALTTVSPILKAAGFGSMMMLEGKAAAAEEGIAGPAKDSAGSKGGVGKTGWWCTSLVDGIITTVVPGELLAKLLTGTMTCTAVLSRMMFILTLHVSICMLDLKIC